MPSPIRLHTIKDLLDRNHTLQLYCLRCDRWRTAPLERLTDRGLGAAPIRTLRFRCIRCGTPAQLQLRPPELPAAAATGWTAVEHRPWNIPTDFS